MLAGTIDIANIGQISQEKPKPMKKCFNEIQNYKQKKVLEFKQSIKRSRRRIGAKFIAHPLHRYRFADRDVYCHYRHCTRY